MLKKSILFVLALSLLTCVAQAQPLVQFTFDDGNAVDVSGNGFEGTLLGIAPDPNDPNDPNQIAEVVEDPNRGMVMKINGKGLQVDGPLDINESFTLSAWIKLDEGQNGRNYFSASGKWLIRADNMTSKLRDALEINIPYSPRKFWGKMDTTAGATTEGILDGQWHHVVIVLSDGNEVTGYYDGEAVTTITKSPVSLGGEVGPLNFGGNISGYMDDIRVYNYAVEADAIPGLMGKLLARYTFDDGTARDVSGNANDGILLGIAPDPNDPNDPNMIAEVIIDETDDGALKINKQGMQVDGPFALTDTFTLTSWIKLEPGQTGRNYFSASGKWLIRADNKTSKLRDALEVNIPYSPRVFWDKIDTTDGGTTEGILDGQWHHVAVVLKDGVEVQGYHNGVQVMNKVKNAVDLGGEVGPLNFGGNIDGCMDDIRLYSVALDPNEVMALVNPDGIEDPNAVEQD